MTFQASLTVPADKIRYAGLFSPPLEKAAKRRRICGTEAKALVESVANRYGLTFAQIATESRKHRIAHVRQACMAALHETGLYSLPSIGKLFNRDHTTVLFALRAHAARSDGPPVVWGRSVKGQPKMNRCSECNRAALKSFKGERYCILHLPEYEPLSALPIDVEAGRSSLASGGALIEAAEKAGTLSAKLDLELWNNFGKPRAS